MKKKWKPQQPGTITGEMRVIAFVIDERAWRMVVRVDSDGRISPFCWNTGFQFEDTSTRRSDFWDSCHEWASEIARQEVRKKTGIPAISTKSLAMVHTATSTADMHLTYCLYVFVDVAHQNVRTIPIPAPTDAGTASFLLPYRALIKLAIEELLKTRARPRQDVADLCLD